MKGRRDHVPGQRLAQPVPQGTGLDRPRPRVEGHQPLALAGPRGDHHRAVADARHPQQGVLDLADLDAEAADLDLAVPAAEELQLAVRPPAAVVAAQVEALALAVRVGHVALPGALGVVDVAAADADPGEGDQAGRAERNRPQVLVHHVDPHVADRAAERDPLAVRRHVHDLVVGVVRGLGQPVRVDQPDPGLGREPALGELSLQRLPGHRHVPQVRQLTGMLVQVGQHHLEVGRDHLQDVDPAVGDRVDEPRDVQDHLLLDDQRSPADQERGYQLPHRDVEALGRGLRDHLPRADLQVFDLGVQVVEHARVLAHRALRLTGGAAREVDVGELSGPTSMPRSTSAWFSW